jgi:uncharacterized protein YlxP (DUF503 family)
VARAQVWWVEGVDYRGMVIGACRLELILPENHSLKGKRSVVRSICAQVRQTFNVAIAEVADHDSWQVAGLGFAVVSTDGRHVDQMVAEIVDFIERRAEGQLGRYEVEHLHPF